MTDINVILEKTKELGMLLKDTESVKEFQLSKLSYDQNRELQELIGQFNIHKMSIASLSSQDNPDAQRISMHEDELKSIYDKIMGMSVVAEYQEKSQSVEKLIFQINSILNMYAFGYEENECSGYCASCKGCSQKK